MIAPLEPFSAFRPSLQSLTGLVKASAQERRWRCLTWSQTPVFMAFSMILLLTHPPGLRRDLRPPDHRGDSPATVLWRDLHPARIQHESLCRLGDAEVIDCYTARKALLTAEGVELACGSVPGALCNGLPVSPLHSHDIAFSRLAVPPHQPVEGVGMRFREPCAAYRAQ